MRRRTDYFGNEVATFAVTEGHPRLIVTATSAVEVERQKPQDPAGSPPWEALRDALSGNRQPAGLLAYQFCFASPQVPLRQALADYAAASFMEGRTILAALSDLTERIHNDFTYDPEATTVSTPVEEVFESRRGVCQDLAHVQIACLRSLGLAARYVSGYLRTVPPAGQPRLIGADASHAWLGVYCGPLGWIDIDPTNNVFVSSDHITVAWGRDYGDVCPVSGMFIGRGDHQMHVRVDIEPILSGKKVSAAKRCQDSFSSTKKRVLTPFSPGLILTQPTMCSSPAITSRLAWGRDYGDVCPVSGMFIGRGDHQMHVRVDVEPI